MCEYERLFVKLKGKIGLCLTHVLSHQMPPTICFHKGNFEDAREKYIDALNTLGYQADLAYNIALCSYKLKQFGPALKYITEIIDRGVQEHPELSVGSNADGIEVRSVGNSPVLQETYLIEAFNLKVRFCERLFVFQ
jgi:tetratricopeptide repeat protein 30